jgi:hypothetical protein
VEVRTDDNGRDEFLIYMTSGSNGSAPDQLAGMVTDTPDGPEWVHVYPPMEDEDEN